DRGPDLLGPDEHLLLLPGTPRKAARQGLRQGGRWSARTL
ncbi:hypothetical protein AVDCRST_MAG82-1824, partial [uncultured Rubrobacteraceae bacterium]